MVNKTTLNKNYNKLVSVLISEMNREGFWTGRLSSSALATSVAIVALKTLDDPGKSQMIKSGFDWLLGNINNDGGFGDTPESLSNVSTTLLCLAAINYCQTNGEGEVALKRVKGWLNNEGITTEPNHITRSILEFYGKDLTFSVPILSMLHLAGIIPSASLNKIPVLPFELTLLPQSLYRFFNMRVVSYALPALIGVGIYLQMHREKGAFNLMSFRKIFINQAIRKLNNILPESGGFLEAIPLTAFVSMCLVACGRADSETVRKGTGFLVSQQRDDGSWPIDTDLSTWVTTLSVKALAKDIGQFLSVLQVETIREHLLGLQYKENHPFNGARPGGWGWTSYSGSVPDADDTPGAILALHELFNGTKRERQAMLAGCRWLMGLQNSDGGIPTFCKGWGRLPFDKSCADLTGHSILALAKTYNLLESTLDNRTKSKMRKCMEKAITYLERHQRQDGSWIPLWFGNQYSSDQTNPVYGTAKVCIYLNDCFKQDKIESSFLERIKKMTHAATSFLINQQNIDGSWGGGKDIPGTIEETSLALCALAAENQERYHEALKWLNTRPLISSPIGLYFSLLWYDEKMYPLIYLIEAHRRLLNN